MLLILTLGSCEKEYCWQCTVKVYITTGNKTTESQSERNECGKTEAEINTYQKEGSTKTQSGSGSSFYSQLTRINCRK